MSSEPSTQPHNGLRDAYTFVLLLIALLWYLAKDMSISNVDDAHLLLSVTISILAFSIGIFAHLNFQASKKVTFSISSIGFVSLGILDCHNCLVSATAFHSLVRAPLAAVAPWSWILSGVVFVFLLLQHLLFTLKQQGSNTPREIDFNWWAFAPLALILTFLLYISYLPLPRAYYPELFSSLPAAHVIGALSLSCLVGYHTVKESSETVLQRSIMISLLISLLCNALFLSSSYRMVDLNFLIAEILRLMSYACILLGLIFNLKEMITQYQEELFEYTLSKQLLSEELESRIEIEQELSQQRFIAFNVADDARHAQLLAEESKRNFEAVVEGSPNGLLGVDVHGDIVVVNDALLTMFGYSADELVGKTSSILVPEDVRDEHIAYYNDFVKNASEYPVRVLRSIKGLTRSQGEFFADVGLRAVQSGGPIHTIVSISDVTDRLLKEEQLTSTGKILNNSLNEIFIVSKQNYSFLYLNRGAKNNTGLSGKLSEEVTLLDLMPSLDKESLDKLLIPIIDQSQEILSYESKFMRQDGSYYDVQIHFQLGTYKFEDVVMLVVMDISETNRFQKALERSNRELSEFAYVASHDLKAPLRAIGNYTKWIVEDSEEPLHDTTLDYLSKINVKVDRMNALLEDLLLYARVDLASDAPVTLEVKNAIAEVIDMLFVPKGFTITIDVNVEKIHCHKAPFQLVFRNLIGNAIKHHHSENGTIHIKGRKEGNSLTFDISDDGPGIPEKFHEKIFGMFESLKSEREGGGTGMGLALVKKVVESHGGNISLHSEEGKGSQFTFTWPIR